MFAIDYLPIVIEIDIPKINKTMRNRIKDAIETRLMIDPVGFGKPLQHTLKGYRRLRVGDYRIVFRIYAEKEIVTILAIAHRKDIYEMNFDRRKN